MNWKDCDLRNWLNNYSRLHMKNHPLFRWIRILWNSILFFVDRENEKAV